MKAYTAFYSSQFKPEQGTLQDWMTNRDKRINKPGAISVEVDNLTVRNLSPDTIEASFVQHYRSSGYSDSMNKTLKYQLESGQWKIVRESNR